MSAVVATQEDILSVITRVPVPPGQITLFKALYEAHDHWLSKYELAREIRGGDEKSVLGVLGALGTRVNYTKGFGESAPGIGLLFDVEVFHGEWHYRLLPETRAAIETLPELCRAISLTTGEIHREYGANGLRLTR